MEEIHITVHLYLQVNYGIHCRGLYVKLRPLDRITWRCIPYSVSCIYVTQHFCLTGLCTTFWDIKCYKSRNNALYRKLYVSWFIMQSVVFPVAQQPKSDLGRPVADVSRLHTQARAVGLFWTSYQIVLEAATYASYNKTHEHEFPHRDSKESAQKSSGCGPVPLAARPLGSARDCF